MHLGISSYPKGGIVKSRQEGCGNFNTPISIITDDYEYISYPTIGHETFHLINHGSHKDVNARCHIQVLDVYDVPYLEKFQWSDDCCLLTNKPQSLNFEQPPMNPKYQCQCYGYETNYFVELTECKEVLTCEDAKKNEQTFPRIVDDEFCRDKWERKRDELMKLLHITTSTVSATTILPLTTQDQCEWIGEKKLSSMMFIFPQENEEDNDDGLVCLAIIVEGSNSDKHKMAFTAKSCVKNEIKFRNYQIKKQDGNTVAESQSDADFSVTIELIDNLDKSMASLRPADISENFIQLSELTSSQQIMDKEKQCLFINVIRTSDPMKPFTIKYIPIDISIQYKEDSTFNYVIRSKNEVNKSELLGLKGNPLFCRLSGEKKELVGILVDDDDDKHLRFVNIADYKEIIQKTIAIW